MPVNIGKILLVTGIILVITGTAIMFISKFSAVGTPRGASILKGTGKLPGDIYIQKKNFTFYFPLASCIIISVIASLILWFIKH